MGIEEGMFVVTGIMQLCGATENIFGHDPQKVGVGRPQSSVMRTQLIA